MAVTTEEAATPMAAFQLRPALRAGWIAGLSYIFAATIGMVQTFESRNVIHPILSLGYVVLIGIAVWGGHRGAAKATSDDAGPRATLLAGAVAGATAGAIASAYLIIINTFDVRDVFTNISPALVDILNLDSGLGVGLLVTLFGGTALAVAGASLKLLSPLMRRAVVGAALWILVVGFLEVVLSQIMRELHLGVVAGLLVAGGGSWTLLRHFGRRRTPLLFVGFAAVAVIGVYAADAASHISLNLSGLADFFYINRVGGRALTIGGAITVVILSVAFTVLSDAPRKRARARITSMDADERQQWLFGMVAIFVALGIFLPMVFGSLINELLATTGLFLLMGLGLNIVVGYAGLLDLGYVAFFAVGAYTTAILTSPLSKISFSWGIGDFTIIDTPLSFWEAMPFVIVAAAIAGILVGTPVIRMRGDYLAIVTLGFGEIARILFLSDWLKGVTNGAQGISRIPSIDLGVTTVKGTDQQMIFYMIFAFVLLAAYVSWRLQDSRIGRSWMAMREDEQVAQTMGVNIVRAKLLAFVIGAILASFSGALFAVKFGTIFPASFSLIVSITVLVLIIVGGMGNIPGVAVGALVMIGVLGGRNSPGLLREFESFKLLIYGLLLVYMMLQRPEGLLPSKRRARELHQDEALQDAWLRAELDSDDPIVGETS